MLCKSIKMPKDTMENLVKEKEKKHFRYFIFVFPFHIIYHFSKLYLIVLLVVELFISCHYYLLHK